VVGRREVEVLREALERMQQVGVLHHRTCMASLDRHLYQHLHDCATWAFHPQRFPLVGAPLLLQHYLTRRCLHCYFGDGSRLGRRAQAAQARLGAASLQAQVVHLQWAEPMKHPLSRLPQGLIDHS
jgi:hypothetical protein